MNSARGVLSSRQFRAAPREKAGQGRKPFFINRGSPTRTIPLDFVTVLEYSLVANKFISGST